MFDRTKQLRSYLRSICVRPCIGTRYDSGPSMFQVSRDFILELAAINTLTPFVYGRRRVSGNYRHLVGRRWDGEFITFQHKEKLTLVQFLMDLLLVS